MTDEDATRPKPGAPNAPNGSDGSGRAEQTDGAAVRDGAAEAALEALQLRAELAELKDRWMRTQADLENYKALELNNGGTDIRLTKRDIYR